MKRCYTHPWNARPWCYSGGTDGGEWKCSTFGMIVAIYKVGGLTRCAHFRRLNCNRPQPQNIIYL